MILVSSHHLAQTISGIPVYIADKGSNVPHSVYINGQIDQLLDPPALSAVAGPEPLFVYLVL